MKTKLERIKEAFDEEVWASVHCSACAVPILNGKEEFYKRIEDILKEEESS